MDLLGWAVGLGRKTGTHTKSKIGREGKAQSQSALLKALGPFIGTSFRKTKTDTKTHTTKRLNRNEKNNKEQKTQNSKHCFGQLLLWNNRKTKSNQETTHCEGL